MAVRVNDQITEVLTEELTKLSLSTQKNKQQIGRLFLNFLINLILITDSPVSSSSSSFIGCWWMPFVIYGCIIFASAITMFFFPKHMKYYYISKQER